MQEVNEFIVRQWAEGAQGTFHAMMQRSTTDESAKSQHMLQPNALEAIVKKWTFDRVIATIRAIAHTMAADHALALRAATKAASPRQGLAEVRAMYVPPSSPDQESDASRRAVARANILHRSPRRIGRRVAPAGAPLGIEGGAEAVDEGDRAEA